MKAIQYSMCIPKDTQDGFIDYAKKVLGPTWEKYGCKKYECYKVLDQRVAGRQTIEQDRFIERIYFDDDFDIQSFFKTIKDKEPEKARSYENTFRAYQIELRIVGQIV
jgi:hypothetical protein